MFEFVIMILEKSIIWDWLKTVYSKRKTTTLNNNNKKNILKDFESWIKK